MKERVRKSSVVSLSTVQIMFIALIMMMTAAAAEAFMNFGLTGQNCKVCHTLFAGGLPVGDAEHIAHAMSVNNDCSVCHAPGLTVPPPMANCSQCHFPAGLREHHRNAGVHQCSGCHMNPETASPESTIPTGYAGTGLDPCNGSEELFVSFTMGLDNDGDLLYDGDDPDCQAGFESNCSDGIDNDGDGLVDCDDQDCADDPACLTPLVETSCTDGVDNDGDGFIDCTDTDCFSDPACVSGGTNHLNTTCLACHTDRSALASCSTGTNHTARVGQQVWDETLVELGLNCNNTGGNVPTGPPASHTDREDGFMHKPGKSRPFTNGCTACHGNDLTGSIARSCFTCHGKEWDENAPSAGGNDPAEPPVSHTDRDGDGYAESEDCNDGDAKIYPGAAEVCGNTIDENCDGVDEICVLLSGDYAIKKIKSDKSVRVGKKVKIRVYITNKNGDKSDPGALLTVYGKMKGRLISIAEAKTVFDSTEPGSTRYSFTYKAVKKGKVRWYAKLSDRSDPENVLDTASSKTKIKKKKTKKKKRDDDDDD
jgi:hypothetical protein